MNQESVGRWAPKRNAMIVLAALIAVGALAWVVTHAGSNEGKSAGRNRPTTTVGIAQVQLADMPVTLSAIGTVQPIVAATVRTQLAGDCCSASISARGRSSARARRSPRSIRAPTASRSTRRRAIGARPGAAADARLIACRDIAPCSQKIRSPASRSTPRRRRCEPARRHGRGGSGRGRHRKAQPRLYLDLGAGRAASACARPISAITSRRATPTASSSSPRPIRSTSPSPCRRTSFPRSRRGCRRPAACRSRRSTRPGRRCWRQGASSPSTIRSTRPPAR